MKRKILIKAIFILSILILYEIFIPKNAYASIDKQTWRTNTESHLQEVSLSKINGAVYSKNYNYNFINQDNANWSGKTVYGGGLQGSVVTERHIIFAILSGGRQNGYLFIANKNTGTIEQSIPVANNGSESIYGHMNDLAYNPKTKEIFLPYTTNSGTGKVVIFKYNSNGSVNTTPTIVNQCSGINCSNMAYNESLDKYIFNNGRNIYIVSRNGNGFNSAPDKHITYDQKDFKYMIAQSLCSTGRYFYKIFSEDGSDNSYQETYYDSQEAGSAIAAVYDLETGDFLRALYVPNSVADGELEGISIDPSDGSMFFAYNLSYLPDEGSVNKVAFYKLNIGNQVINNKEYYFYNTGFVAPKATITAQNAGVNENIIRYFNGNNNLGDDHSNYTKIWKDLSGKRNGTIEGGTTFTNQGYLNLDGTDDWVNLGELPDSVYSTITMDIEISFNEINDEEMCLLANMETGGYGLILVEGKPQFQAYIDGKYEKVKFDEKLLKDRVYNITGTFDGKKLCIYVDGVLRNTTILSGNKIVTKPINNTVMAIGTNPNQSHATAGFTNGKVFSARIYEKALTEEQIKKNMNADRLSTTKLSSSWDSINITINFSEPVKDFTIDDINVLKGEKGQFVKVSDKQYELEIKNIVGTDNLEIKIENGSFTDLTGNKGIGTQIQRYRDMTGPKATITANTQDFSTAQSIIYNISFNEPTTGFCKENIQITNGIKSNFFETTEGMNYTLEVNNINNGNHKILIPINSCYDASGNSNIASTKTIIIDRNAPIIEKIEGNPINWTKGSVTLRVKATDDISGLNDKAYSFDGGATWQSSNEKTYSDNVENIEIQVRDKLGNVGKTNLSITKIIKLKRIEVITPSTKTNYAPGQNFDKTGMKVEAIYTNDIGEEITNYEIVNGNNLKLGQESVTIRYIENNIEKTATQPITVTKKELANIRIKTAPEKIKYIEGEDFDKTGLKVEAIYSDGSREEITNYEIVNGNNLKLGQESVTIRYIENNIEKTATQPITVTEKELANIRIKTAPEKIKYVEGENFDKTGLKVEAIYSDNSRKEITNYEIVNGNNLKLGQESVTIKYVEKNIEKVVKQPIIISEKLKVKTENYIIIEKDGKKYIENIMPETTKKELKENIYTNGEIEIYKENLKMSEEQLIIGTGMTIKIKLEDQEEVYEVIVVGDVTGDGKLKMADLLKLARYKAGIDKNLEGTYLRAGDVIEDGKIGMTDILKLSRVLAGIENL